MNQLEIEALNQLSLSEIIGLSDNWQNVISVMIIQNSTLFSEIIIVYSMCMYSIHSIDTDTSVYCKWKKIDGLNFRIFTVFRSTSKVFL